MISAMTQSAPSKSLNAKDSSTGPSGSQGARDMICLMLKSEWDSFFSLSFILNKKQPTGDTAPER